MLLQAIEITKQLGQRYVLKGVTMSLDRNESVALFGPNGAGKTTLINIFATLLRPTSGKFTILSQDVSKNPFSLRPRIGLVAHDLLAYPELTPSENLRFFGQLYGVEKLEARITALLEYVGLAPFANEPVRIFSRGMTQRLMIAKALIHDPEILLLDEPFTGLDTSAQQFMLRLILDERAKGKGIFLTTHDIELGYKAGSRFVFLIDGQIEEVGLQKTILLKELQQRYTERLSQKKSKT